MTSADQPALTPDVALPARSGYVRIGAGLAQGLVLYLLYRAHSANAWPATAPYLFVPAVMLGVMLPGLFITGLGHIKTRTLAAWLGGAALLLSAMALHDVWRNAVPVPSPSPSSLLVVFSAIFLFIAHSLAMASARDQRRIASYATHFETAWKFNIQLSFSAFFVGALWIGLWLGSTLFKLVGLRFLEQLLEKSWFVLPLLCGALSFALHLTDVRPAIVKGIRTLLLVLMSWLLPVATLIVAGFLCSLPFTGLQVLWDTRSATAVLLVTAAMLIVLINATWQNGEADVAVPRVLRHSARVACALLLPIVAIATYALALRVGDYGWTTDRIIGAACLLVALCYAIGYAVAAFSKGPWLAPLAKVNLAAAYVVLAVLFSLFSPIADPARLSVADQVARLQHGLVKPDRFDFAYLSREGRRYGRNALQALQQHALADVRARATKALTNPYEPAPVTPTSLSENLKVWPEGTGLPASFPVDRWKTDNPYLPACLRLSQHFCDVFLLDLTGDQQNEMIVISRTRNAGAVVLHQVDGEWSVLGRLPDGIAGCTAVTALLKAGQFRVADARVKEIELGGQRLWVNATQPIPPCDTIPAPATSD